MNFDLTQEQKMLSDSARRYLRENYSFETFREILKKDNGFSEQQWLNFAELGWLLVEYPAIYDGLGCSMLEITILAEEMGRSMVLEPFVSTAVISSFLLLKSGNQALCDLMLADIASGYLRLALAHGEPGSRYSSVMVEQNLLATKALKNPSGYVVSGQKTLVSDAASAQKYIVSAALGHDMALFLVDRKASGVNTNVYPLIAGGHAADVILEAVQLEPSALLSRGKDAQLLLQEALDRAVIVRIAMAIGAMENILELCAEHLKNREQFKQPIGKFQALQHRMAEMFVEVQESRSALYRGLAFLGADPTARQVAISMAKVVVCKSAKIVGGLGIQLHGGIGLTEEYPVGHYFRYLTCFEKSYGDLDFHLRKIISMQGNAA